MKLILDSSVWIEHLRRDLLAPVLPLLRGKFQLWMDPFVAGELLAGCRTREQRRTVETLLRSFTRAGRIRPASVADLQEAGRALSKLRQEAVSLSSPAGALIDAGIAVGAARLGARVVTLNERDFARLARFVAFRWQSWAELDAALR